MIKFDNVFTNVSRSVYPAHIKTDLSWNEFVRKVLIDWAKYTEAEANSKLEGCDDSELSGPGFYVDAPSGSGVDNIYLLRSELDPEIWVAEGLTSEQLEKMAEILNNPEAQTVAEQGLSRNFWPVLAMMLTATVAVVWLVLTSISFFAGLLSILGESTPVCVFRVCYSMQFWVFAACVSTVLSGAFTKLSHFFFGKVVSVR